MSHDLVWFYALKSDFLFTYSFNEKVTCSVQNGSALIDLSPLIHVSGHYTATGQ